MMLPAVSLCANERYNNHSTSKVRLCLSTAQHSTTQNNLCYSIDSLMISFDVWQVMGDGGNAQII
jgi:hypothetical protein